MVCAFRYWLRGNDVADAGVGCSARTRCRYLGCEHPRRVGICDCEFRMVDRYWPCGNVDFCNPAAASPGVAPIDQPFCRSDDTICRHVRWLVPIGSPGQALVLLLAHSL